MEVKHSVDTDMLLLLPCRSRSNKYSKDWTYEIISTVERRCAVSIMLASSVDLKSENNRRWAALMKLALSTLAFDLAMRLPLDDLGCNSADAGYGGAGRFSKALFIFLFFAMIDCLNLASLEFMVSPLFLIICLHLWNSRGVRWTGTYNTEV